MDLDSKRTISEEVKRYFTKYTTYKDIEYVVSKEDVEVSFHTLRRLRIANINISNKKREHAVNELLRKAIDNVSKEIEENKRHKKRMKELIKTI